MTKLRWRSVIGVLSRKILKMSTKMLAWFEARFLLKKAVKERVKIYIGEGRWAQYQYISTCD